MKKLGIIPSLALAFSLLALPGLVHDHEEGERSLPMLLALRTGTPRLLLLAGVFTALVSAGILIAGRTVGLT